MLSQIKMRYFLSLFLAAIVSIIQVSFVASFRNDWINLNIVLLLTFAFYYLGYYRAALFTGVFCGLFVDLLENSNYIGLTGFVISVSVVLGMLTARYTTGNRVVKFVYILTGVFLYKTLAFWPAISSFFPIVFPSVLFELLGFLIIVRIVKYIGQFWREDDFKQLSFGGSF